jgi:predicted ATPase
MAYPDAAILMFENGPPRWIEYRDTEHYGVTRTFLNDTERMLDILLDRKLDPQAP